MHEKVGGNVLSRDKVELVAVERGVGENKELGGRLAVRGRRPQLGLERPHHAWRQAEQLVRELECHAAEAATDVRGSARD
eukprot:scaffold13099_cov79-Isochrysis_galbana.AAC.2